MSRTTTVYDLGEIESAPRLSEVPAEPAPVRRPQPGPALRTAVRPMAMGRPSLIDPIADSLNLVVPGTGQMLRGHWSTGFAVAAWVGLLLSLAWAVHETLPRLDATLPLLGYPREAGVWVLAGLFVAVGFVHVTAISLRDNDLPFSPHPVVSGVASALIPGWGQLLNGQRVKAATFVVGLWVVAASWGLSTPVVDRLFERYDLYMPPLLESFRSPLVRWTIPAVLWTLALYDAVTSAEARR